MSADLSPDMERAVELAKTNAAGRLYRWPGGYWMPRMRDPHRTQMEVLKPGQDYAGTLTVNALIERGIMQPIAKMSRGAPWIVEMKP